MKKRLSIEFVNEFALTRGIKLLSKEYKNARTKLKFECEVGHIYDSTFDNFKRIDGRCPRCVGSGKLNYEYVKNYLENEGYILISTSYMNNREKLNMECPKGHTYLAQFGSFQQGHRCKECAEIEKIKRQTHTYEYVKNYIEVESNSDYKLLSNRYIDNETPLVMLCDKEHEIKMTFGNFKSHGKRCLTCFRENNIGENHPTWNPNITQEEREIQRHIQGYPEWRLKVYQKDNYTCHGCGDNQGGNLNAHHLDGYNWCKERRTDISNGITLCNDCHSDFHRKYGYGDNTESQYDEWITDKLNNIQILNTSPLG